MLRQVAEVTLRLLSTLLAAGFLILLGWWALDSRLEARRHRRAQDAACDQLVDHARSRADTLDTVRWCGDHGVLFSFDPAPRR